MAARKVPPEVQEIFDKYIHNFVRRLKKEDACVMLQKEFNLSQERAEHMFDFFDMDKNGALSIWEFHQFYVCMGNSANEYLDLFNKLDKDSSGHADIGLTWEELKKLTTQTGRHPTDEELEQFIKGAAGQEKSINLNKFIGLISRIKQLRN
ncbi:hypothetical protein CHS0354_030221 [Potamilus streckersoni]|uniref:EF-hand domain-containing protein n=1 Tax=Potamilus streckersoni TaxID=2493646 RepID=A0AAE0RSH4_9BIVA|nr:hypothetical protein CHS0354_030221 [Potamilus streckersoni]